MMPIIMADPGKPGLITRVGGSNEVRQQLADMGFVPGETVPVISTVGGNVIVKIKESRVAISREMAQKIMI